ncbi:MAG: glucosaminidase domain-containing protein [Bacteroidota bacterium]
MQNDLARRTPPPFAFMNFKGYAKQLKANWFEMLMIPMIAYLFISKDVSISFQMGPDSTTYAVENNFSKANQANLAVPVSQSVNNKKQVERGFNLGDWLDSRKPAAPQKKKSSTKLKKVPRAQHFSNLTFIMSPTYAERKGIPASVVQEKKDKCNNYVKKYLKAALNEQKEYNILASITLAQGLLESNAGDSRLARESLNHFGIKCRRKCRGCTCRNYHDDDIYDMFRVFKNPTESYREHSILLNNSRYKKLQQYGNDYKKWAHGLKKAGYATDKRYAEKLIMIIEALNLDRYDGL